MANSQQRIPAYMLSLFPLHTLPSDNTCSSIAPVEETAERKTRSWAHMLHEDDLPIHKASFHGEVSILISLVTETKYLDIRSNQDSTPLHLAIYGNQPEAVKILLSAGANHAEPDYSPIAHDVNAITLAATINHHETLKVMLECGLEPSQMTLRMAASAGSTESVRIILEWMENNDLSGSPSKGDALSDALTSAAGCWHVDAVYLLLTYIDDIPDKTKALSIALICAVSSYDCDDRCRDVEIYDKPQRLFSILETLVTHGADVNFKDVEAGRDTAFWACVEQNPDIPRYVVYFLLSKGMRVDESSRDGMYPIFIAARDRNGLGLIEAMIAVGAKVDVTASDLTTPLHYAATLPIAECLVSFGADISARDELRRTPLHQACKSGHADIAEFLISKGANVNEPATMQDLTPLHFATTDQIYGYWCFSHKACLDVLKLLLSYGADIHAKASDGSTSLHMAISGQDHAAISVFLSHGANIHSEALDGSTPLHFAASRGDDAIVKILLEKGADVSSVTEKGDTPLHLSCARDSTQWIPAIVDTLLAHGADLEATNKSGATPLFVAMKALQGRYGPEDAVSVINMLLTKGADRSAKDETGTMAIELLNRAMWEFEDANECKLKQRRTYVPTRGRGRGGWRGGRGRGG